MSDCIRWVPMLDAREGELDAGERAGLATHLEGCARCRALAADLAATDGLLAEGLLGRAAARDFAPFVDQVMARVDPAAGSSGWLRRHWRAVAAMVVPALAAAAVFMYVHNGGLGGDDRYAAVEMSAEGRVSAVLHTAEGPVVLLEPDEQGS